MTCRICQNSEANVSFEAREMMFGRRDRFRYFECAKCGCLQLEEEVSDLPKYYPPNYYSHQNTYTAPTKRRGKLDQFLRARLLQAQLGHRDLIGSLLQRLMPGKQLFDFLQGTQLPLHFDSAILDVGCGTGNMLQTMYAWGFNHLLGADPFIERDLIYADHFKILKRPLDQVEGEFDLILMHHSFEHMPDPRGAIRAAAQRLTPSGVLVISGPIAKTYGWNHYGVDWVALDAPRHLFVPTHRSMQALAELGGLEISKVIHNSTEFLFWASEQYKMDIPLQDERSVLNSPPNGPFTADQMRDFGVRAAELNRLGDADQAAIFFTKRRPAKP